VHTRTSAYQLQIKNNLLEDDNKLFRQIQEQNIISNSQFKKITEESKEIHEISNELNREELGSHSNSAVPNLPSKERTKKEKDLEVDKQGKSSNHSKGEEQSYSYSSPKPPKLLAKCFTLKETSPVKKSSIINKNSGKEPPSSIEKESKGAKESESLQDIKNSDSKGSNNNIKNKILLNNFTQKPVEENVFNISAGKKPVYMVKSHHQGNVESIFYFQYVFYRLFDCCYSSGEKNSTVKFLSSSKTREKFSFEFYLKNIQRIVAWDKCQKDISS